MNSLLKTVTGQRRDCDLNPSRTAPESSTLTTRLPSHPSIHYYALNHSERTVVGRLVCTSIGWRRGVVVSGVRRMNEVNARRARLVPAWVTVFGRVYHLGM